MDVLIDTHTLLWHYLDDPKLSAQAKAIVTAPANRVFVSPASHWEVAIKVSTGKYTLTVPFGQFIQEAIFDNGFVILPVEPRHTELVSRLPRHHNDPFDRLLIAQALADGLAIVSVDPAFDPYGVRRLW